MLISDVESLSVDVRLADESVNMGVTELVLVSVKPE